MSKQTAILVVATVIFVLGVFVVSNLNSKNNNNVQGVSQTGQKQDQSGDPMHQPQPINSSVFDSLVGKKASDFNLTSYDGKNYSLQKLKGKNIVLFFSEGLMCYPACWDQIAAFGKDSRFNGTDTIALTIVNDRKEDWKGAIDKMPDLAQATVLFDTDRAVSVAYGVLNLPSSMHRGQLAGHSYVIIDKQGVIRYVLDDPNMAIGNDNLFKQIGTL